MMHRTTDGKSRLWGGPFLQFCLLLASVLSFNACATTLLPRTTEASLDAGLLKRLCDDVAKLTELDPSRRASNVESLNRAAEYIIQEFRKTGCRLEQQHFTVDGRDYRNISSFGPGEGEHVIVGAHYDVSDEKGDQPGAADNASGVAGILELARMVSREKPALARRLDLVAFTPEEPPYFETQKEMGSYVTPNPWMTAEYLYGSWCPLKLSAISLRSTFVSL